MKFKNIFICILAATFIISCDTAKKNKRTIIGSGAGVAVGGVIGGLLGKKAGNTAGGVIIGAAVGGVAGGVIGRYMDKQKAEIEEELGKTAKVERVGEGIDVTFDSGILYEVNGDQLSASSQNELTKFAETLKKYDQTNILIDGHTDNTGTDAYNQQLSMRRAESVSKFLQARGVVATRLGTRGFGESKPATENTTETGRKQNRRVEVAIWANDKLQEDAKKGELDANK
ncbi:MAG: OmpA family protein [Verrucomicrobia bacterium]|nr:OmpA family protein [Cytophagales bacterium]